MTIETTVTITPDDADAAGRLLLALAEARTGAQLHTGAVEYAFRTMMPNEIMTVANALLALGNDTDAIIAPGDEEDEEDEEDMPAYVREHFEEQDRITAGYDAAVEGDVEIYVSKNVPTGWTFDVHYESDGLVRYFNKLEDGLREYSGAVIYFTEPNQPDRLNVIATPKGWAVWDRKDRRFCDGVFENRNTAETWKSALDRAVGVPECDISPESVLEVAPVGAGLVGDMLKFIANHRGAAIHTPALFMKQIRKYLEELPDQTITEVGDALQELSRDKNVQIVQEEVEL